MARVRAFALALALVAAACAATAAAQVADLRDYPNLAALKAYLDQRSAGAQRCAAMNQLFVEANAMLRANVSEADAARELVRVHQGKRDAKQRAALSSIATAVADNANVLLPLAEDSAFTAFAQMCVDNARGRSGDARSLEGAFEAALKCETAHPAGSLERRDCVAGAFRAR